MWYSFLITSFYGGELRAFLLKPVLLSPIDTVQDIVESGSKWKAVDYGDFLWIALSNASFIDGIEQFSEEMEFVDYNPFPIDYVSCFLL